MKRFFVFGFVLLVGCADVRREGELIQAEHERKLKEISNTDFERIEDDYRLRIAELEEQIATASRLLREHDREKARQQRYQNAANCGSHYWEPRYPLLPSN